MTSDNGQLERDDFLRPLKWSEAWTAERTRSGSALVAREAIWPEAVLARLRQEPKLEGKPVP